MQKPNNFDNVSTGDFTPVTPGGHHLIIKKVEETKSKAGKDMIIVAFDMAPGDSQPNYISKLFADDIRPDKKWPRAGRQYIVVTDSDGNTSRSFKSFITCVEKSNNGFVTQWGDAFAQQFKALDPILFRNDIPKCRTFIVRSKNIAKASMRLRHLLQHHLKLVVPVVHRTTAVDSVRPDHVR